MLKQYLFLKVGEFMKYKDIFIIIVLLLVFFNLLTSSYASNIVSNKVQSKTEDKNKVKDMNGALSNAASWFSPSSPSGNSIGDSIASLLQSQFVPLLGKIGNTVFAAVTVFLGLKYLYSDSNAKAAIKDSLPNFVIGVIFFYLAYTIVTVFVADPNDTSVVGIIGNIMTGNSYDAISNNILGSIAVIVNFASLLGIVIIGIKYMVSSADQKADIKKSMTSIIVGLAFAFCAGSILSLIVGLGDSIL